MSVKSEQAITVLFSTAHASTGAATDADSTPLATLYVNGAASAATVTVTKIATGVYKAAVTLPTVTAGDVVSLRVAATVSGVAGEGVVWQEVADTERVSDLDDLVDDLETRLGTPTNLGSGATIADNLKDIEGQTDDIGMAGAGLTAIPWNAAWDAEAQSEAADALAAYDPPTKAELDAAVSPLATQASVDDLPTNAELATALAGADDVVLAAIAALNNISTVEAQAAAAAALTAYAAAKTSDVTALNDVSSSDVQTAAAAALTAYDPPTKAELDSAVAGMNDLSAAEVRSAVGLAAANLDTQLAALPTAVENADALLTRDMSAPTGEAARSVLNAMRFLRNKWVLSGTTLTVYEEDDTTVAFTATVSTTADADSVTGADPT